VSKYDRYDYGRSRPEEPDEEAPYPRWVFRWAKNAWMICCLGIGTGSLLSLVLAVSAVWHPDDDICNRLGASAGFMALFTTVYGCLTGCFASECKNIRRKYLTWVRETARWEKYQQEEQDREAQEFVERMQKLALANTPAPGTKKTPAEHTNIIDQILGDDLSKPRLPSDGPLDSDKYMN
jgi:hypothetical protein